MPGSLDHQETTTAAIYICPQNQWLPHLGLRRPLPSTPHHTSLFTRVPRQRVIGRVKGNFYKDLAKWTNVNGTTYPSPTPWRVRQWESTTTSPNCHGTARGTKGDTSPTVGGTKGDIHSMATTSKGDHSPSNIVGQQSNCPSGPPYEATHPSMKNKGKYPRHVINN
jgi:hypothetical protein